MMLCHCLKFFLLSPLDSTSFMKPFPFAEFLPLNFQLNFACALTRTLSPSQFVLLFCISCRSYIFGVSHLSS